MRVSLPSPKTILKILSKKIGYWKRNYRKFRITSRWRPGRMLAGIGQSLLLLMIISSMVIGITVIVNAKASNNIPVQVRTFTGPTAVLSVHALLQDSQNGTLYAGTDYGFFQSQDGGSSWQSTNAGLPEKDIDSPFQGVLKDTLINALLQDRQDGTLYAGTSDGFFRSQDRGNTWQAATSGLTNKRINTLLQDSQDGTLYAGTADGFFRSQDRGNTWQVTNPGLPRIYVSILLQDSQNGMLYAGTSGGFFRSQDKGNTWQAANTGLPTTSTGIYACQDAPCPGLLGIEIGVYALLQDGQDGTLYAGTSGSIFRSQDKGNTWQVTNAGLLPNTYIYTLLQDGQGGMLYIGTKDGIFRSQDGGNSWMSASTGLSGRETYVILHSSQDKTLYAATSEGVYKSQDEGSTWQAVSTGLTITGIFTLFQDSQDGTLYAQASNGFFRSQDGGNSWQATGAGITAPVTTMLQDNRDDTIYAGVYYLGIYRSKDGGNSWQLANIGLPQPYLTVFSLLQDNQNGTLYAGTIYGFFKSQDGGSSWQFASAGLPNQQINALLQDSQNGTLYAGTNYGFFKSQNGGSWQSANAGLLDLHVNALLQDSQDGTLYVGTSGGLFRSQDRGNTWQTANSGLVDTNINTLLEDSQDGTLYAGTDNGFFRSQDRGDSWQASNSGLGYTNINTLLQDSQDGTLYIGTNGGFFKSQDGGRSWMSASTGLSNSRTYVILQSIQDKTLYAATSEGVYKSQDEGSTWQAANAGLSGQATRSLLQDSRDGTLYAGTSEGIYKSQDEGSTWQAVNAENDGYSLLQDSQDGTLYIGTRTGVLISQEEGSTWRFVGLDSLYYLDTLFQDKQDNILFASDGESVYQSRDEGDNWSEITIGPLLLDYYKYSSLPDWFMSRHVKIPPTSFKLMDLLNQSYQAVETNKYYYSWGATIIEIQRDQKTLTHQSPFWTFRVWTKFWFIPRIFYFASGIAFFLVIWGLIAWGSAFKALRRNPLRSAKIQETIRAFYAGKPVRPILQKWNNQIYTELVAFGDVLPEDLNSVPELLHRPMMDGFYTNYQEVLSIRQRGRRLVLLAGKPLKNWQKAWWRVSDDLDRHQALSPKGQEQVCLLAQSLADGLGFTLEESHLSKSICAWRLDAPALRLNLPARFPLVFVSDLNPTPETVRQLMDAVSILKDTNNFALVVPLESSIPDVDIPSILRRLIDASPYAHDFIILTQQDVVDILIARHPERVLVQHISRQVDLSFISPFIINGPVPQQMFFGRDREIRTLVDHAGKRNYAIVGNRKIGKTSLLNQVESRINHQGGIRLLRMDCQEVREAADFYTNLQQIPGMQTDITSPAALSVALRALQTQSDQPLVFMLDEVDGLLKTEKDRGEPVLSVMRKLANEQICWFIFCGSKILIRQLRDSESALFNFPETLALAYLSREEMDEVITRPLETLGIQMDNASAVLDAAWKLISGHPNLTQFVGRVLVNASNENQSHSISPADVENLWTDATFVQFYFDTIWGAASSLERLITLLMSPEPFGSSGVEKAFHTAGASATSVQIDAGLETLVAYSVLKRVGRLHTFVPEAFHRLLDLNYEKERLIAREVEKVNGGIE